MLGFQLTFFTQQDRKHHGVPLGQWLLARFPFNFPEEDETQAQDMREIEGYLQTQVQQGVETEYNFAHILVTVPENASPEQIQARRARAAEVIFVVDRSGSMGGTSIEEVRNGRK